MNKLYVDFLKQLHLFGKFSVKEFFELIIENCSYFCLKLLFQCYYK